MLFDKATTPANGDTPIAIYPLPPGNGSVAGWYEVTSALLGAGGKSFTNGIAWGVSTGAGGYVAASGSDHVATAAFI